MGSASSKTESELPEGNKLNSSSASESIKIEFERIEKNLNKSIHNELVKAEQDINDLFISAESKHKKGKPEEISINMTSESDKKKLRKEIVDSDGLSATSRFDTDQQAAAAQLGNLSTSDSSESPRSFKPSKFALQGGLTESEIDVQVVPLMSGGASSLNAQFSESSPFITSEVFKKTLGQNGGAAESEFDSNKLLNIIMQMGGEDATSESDSDKKKSSDSEDEDDEESDSSDLFDDEDDEDEKDEDSDDVFEKQDHQVSRSKKHKNTTSSLIRTPEDDSSSSSTSSSSSASSSSSTSEDSTSDSDKFPVLSPESIGLAIPRKIAGLSGLNSSESESSVYIMSSDSSIGSRDINLLSFDEPAWGKSSKKSKKPKKY